MTGTGNETGAQRRPRAEVWAPLLSGLLAAAAYSLAGVIRGAYPFGSISRSTGDLGQQFTPFHAYFRDLLLGEAHGDFTFTWNTGFGVPFVGDFTFYLGAPFGWLVVLFPRDRIDLALFTIAVLSLALAAAAMTAYLRRLRPAGPMWVAVLLGASYGMCGWAIDDAIYVPTWLIGLIALPVLSLLGLWIISHPHSLRALTVTPLVVGLFWASQFYTVYMATLGAGLITLAHLVTMARTVPWRARFASAVELLLACGLGIGLAAPLLSITFQSISTARGTNSKPFEPVSWEGFVSRVLPGTEGVGQSPGLAIGTMALLLALSLPLNSRVPIRHRITWPLLIMLTALSMQYAPTVAVWHGFDPPDGSSYRQAFVLAAMLVISAWISSAAGLRSLLAVLGPIAIVAAGYVLLFDARFVTPTTRVLVPTLAFVSVLVWLVMRGASTVQRPVRLAAIGAMVLAVLAESAWSAAAIDEWRAKHFAAARPWSDQHARARELVLAADAWPEYRTTPGRQMTVNDALLIGGEGSEYYSSMIPDELAETFKALGFGHTLFGRSPIDPANPVVDSIFSVAARVVDAGDNTDEDPGVADPGATGMTLERREVAPLVTVRQPRTPSEDPSVFGVQETALGADVYQVPVVTPQLPSDLTLRKRGGIDFILTPATGASKPLDLSLTATCAPGSEVYLYAPAFVGDVLIDGRWQTILRSTAKRPGVYTNAPVRRVGKVGDDGAVDVRLRLTQATRIPIWSVGCLDEARLAAAVTNLQEQAPSSVTVGTHSIEATVPAADAERRVVMSVGRINGWRCAVDDGPPRSPKSLGGIIAVPLAAGATRVSCSFRPPGLTRGLAVGGASLLGVAGLAGVVLLLRRRALNTSRMRDGLTSGNASG